MNLSTIILTFNEEENLPRCLESLRALGCAVWVVDSGSSDRTCEIARRYGAGVAAHPFRTHALQWQWALETLPLDSDWVLAIDADQSLTPELVEELRQLFGDSGERREEPARVDGLYIKRRQVFRGRWIKHGGYYPKYLLKLFRRGSVRLDPTELVDHHFYVDGPTARLRHDLVEANCKEDRISFWISKHNRYADLLAREEWVRENRDKATPASGCSPAWLGSPDQRVERLKRVWRRLPLFLRPMLYFFYRYFLRGGWRDGKEGFVFHFLQALWFRLLVDINLDELRLRPPSQTNA